MSFVREIIESDAMVTIDRLNNEMPKMLEESVKLKEVSLNYIESVYAKFSHRCRTVSYFNETQKLMERARVLEEDIEKVLKVDIPASKNEFARCQNQLKQVEDNLKFCNDFNQCNEQLQQVFKHIAVHEYVKAAEMLNACKTVESIKYQELMRKLQKQVALTQITFAKELETLVKEHFLCTSVESADLCTHTLVIKPKSERVQEAIMAFAVLGMHNFVFHEELTKLIWNVFTCIVKHATQVATSGSECVVDVKPTHRDNYSTVFANLSEFAAYLAQSMCYQLNEQQTIMDHLRGQCEVNLGNLIITDCLAATIPEDEAGLEAYAEVEKLTTVLQGKLIAAGILQPDSTKLVDYAAEVKVHFVNRKCDEFSAKAIGLMKKDLHNTVVVGVPFDPSDLAFNGFAQCAISKSTLELMDAVRKMLHKEIGRSVGPSGCYVVSAKNALATYELVVREHHQRLLKTIPQQMALFHNNCKYVAHELASPGWLALLRQLPAPLHEFDGFTLAAQHLNDCAARMLDEATREQVAQIRERIAASGISAICDKLPPTAERAVRECLRQQELLRTVWHKVLNYHDYNRTIGVLLDALSAATAESIMRIADIPADVCDQLVDIVKLIVARGPKLFSEPKEVHMYVAGWGRLGEVLFVLSHGLTLIGERWADGKGPLALHFTSQEMRALVRALFQNSDARAALLAVI